MGGTCRLILPSLPRLFSLPYSRRIKIPSYAEGMSIASCTRCFKDIPISTILLREPFSNLKACNVDVRTGFLIYMRHVSSWWTEQCPPLVRQLAMRWGIHGLQSHRSGGLSVSAISHRIESQQDNRSSLCILETRSLPRV